VADHWLMLVSLAAAKCTGIGSHLFCMGLLYGQLYPLASVSWFTIRVGGADMPITHFPAQLPFRCGRCDAGMSLHHTLLVVVER